VINRPLGRAKLKLGTRLEVRLTKPNTVGFIVRFTMRRGVFPGKKEQCLPPGSKRPTRCPS
jgi:hypothetical protein